MGILSGAVAFLRGTPQKEVAHLALSDGWSWKEVSVTAHPPCAAQRAADSRRVAAQVKEWERMARVAWHRSIVRHELGVLDQSGCSAARRTAPHRPAPRMIDIPRAQMSPA